MEKLYRKHVLKEPEPEKLVQIGIGAPKSSLVQLPTNGKAAAAKAEDKAETREEVGAMGD